MHIVYLVGNGFDLQAKLPTAPQTIVEKYKYAIEKEIEFVKKTGDSASLHLEILQTIHESICDDYESWGDFECALGANLSTACRKVNENPLFYVQAVEHFVRFLYNYISALNTAVKNFRFPQDIDNKLIYGALSCMKDGMRDNHRRIIDTVIQERSREDWIISFINFNYTTLLDRVIETSQRSNRGVLTFHYGNCTYTRKTNAETLHIHGSISDGHGIITGVDNPSQIEVPKFRDDSAVLSAVVKPQLNIDRGDLVEQSSLELISRANIICIFGMAMGKTDGTWWRAIAEWLDKGDGKHILAINAWGVESDIFPRDNRRVVTATLDSFFNGAGINDSDTRKRLEPWIVISRNTKALNFGIDLSPVVL